MVTIVDDNSTDTYDEIIKPFINVMDINIIRSDKNNGPGTSRQIGIDNTHCPFLTFIDADDNFYNCFSLAILVSAITNNEADVVISKFVEEIPSQLIDHSQNFTWMFGKIYRREFLDNNNVRFCEDQSYANEDLGFNLQCKFAGEVGAKIITIADYTYIWRYKEDTITRVNHHSYEFSNGLDGYVSNIIYAINRYGKDKISKTMLYQTLLTGLTECYGSFNKSILSKYNHIYTDTIVDIFKKLYQEYKESYLVLVQAKDFSRLVSKNCYDRNKFLPVVSLYDFLKTVDPEFDLSLIKNEVD